MIGGAGRAEHGAVLRVFDAAQHLAAGASFVIGGLNREDGKALFGVPGGERRPDLQGAIREPTEPSPFKARPYRKNLVHQALGLLVAFGADRAGIFVFHFGAARVDLAD